MPRKPNVRGDLPVYAANIRRLLREREITHSSFAEMVGVAQATMYAALSGGDIRVSTLFRMAKTLKVEPWTLLKPEVETPGVPETHADLNSAIRLLLAEVLKVKT